MTFTDKNRKEAMEFAREVFQTFTTAAGRHPVDLVLERDALIRAKAKAEHFEERIANYYNNGTCPLCLCSDEDGHKQGCLIESLERKAEDFKAEALMEAAERLKKYMNGNHPPHYYSMGVHNALMGYAAILADDPNANHPEFPESSPDQAPDAGKVIPSCSTCKHFGKKACRLRKPCRDFSLYESKGGI